MLEQKNNDEQQKSLGKKKKKTWSTSIALGSLSLAIVASATSAFYFLNNDKKDVLTASSDTKSIPHVAEKEPQIKQKNLERPKQADDQVISAPSYAKNPLVNKNNQSGVPKNQIRSEVSKYLNLPDSNRTTKNSSKNQPMVSAKSRNETTKGKTTNEQKKKAISDPANERTYENKKLKDKEKQEIEKQATNTIGGSRVIKPSKNEQSVKTAQKVSAKQTNAQNSKISPKTTAAKSKNTTINDKADQQPIKTSIETIQSATPSPQTHPQDDNKAIHTSLAAEHVIKKSETSEKTSIANNTSNETSSVVTELVLPTPSEKMSETPAAKEKSDESVINITAAGTNKTKLDILTPKKVPDKTMSVKSTVKKESTDTISATSSVEEQPVVEVTNTSSTKATEAPATEKAATESIKKLQEYISTIDQKLSETQEKINATIQSITETKPTEEIPPQPSIRDFAPDTKLSYEEENAFAARIYANELSKTLKNQKPTNQTLIQELDKTINELFTKLKSYGNNYTYLNTLEELAKPDLSPRSIPIIKSPFKSSPTLSPSALPSLFDESSATPLQLRKTPVHNRSQSQRIPTGGVGVLPQPTNSTSSTSSTPLSSNTRTNQNQQPGEEVDPELLEELKQNEPLNTRLNSVTTDESTGDFSSQIRAAAAQQKQAQASTDTKEKQLIEELQSTELSTDFDPTNDEYVFNTQSTLEQVKTIYTSLSKSNISFTQSFKFLCNSLNALYQIATTLKETATLKNNPETKKQLKESLETCIDLLQQIQKDRKQQQPTLQKDRIEYSSQLRKKMEAFETYQRSKNDLESKKRELEKLLENAQNDLQKEQQDLDAKKKTFEKNCEDYKTNHPANKHADEEIQQLKLNQLSFDKDSHVLFPTPTKGQHFRTISIGRAVKLDLETLITHWSEIQKLEKDSSTKQAVDNITSQIADREKQIEELNFDGDISKFSKLKELNTTLNNAIIDLNDFNEQLRSIATLSLNDKDYFNDIITYLNDCLECISSAQRARTAEPVEFDIDGFNRWVTQQLAQNFDELEQTWHKKEAIYKSALTERNKLIEELEKEVKKPIDVNNPPPPPPPPVLPAPSQTKTTDTSPQTLLDQIQKIKLKTAALAIPKDVQSVNLFELMTKNFQSDVKLLNKIKHALDGEPDIIYTFIETHLNSESKFKKEDEWDSGNTATSKEVILYLLKDIIADEKYERLKNALEVEDDLKIDDSRLNNLKTTLKTIYQNAHKVYKATDRINRAFLILQKFTRSLAQTYLNPICGKKITDLNVDTIKNALFYAIYNLFVLEPPKNEDLLLDPSSEPNIVHEPSLDSVFEKISKFLPLPELDDSLKTEINNADENVKNILTKFLKILTWYGKYTLQPDFLTTHLKKFVQLAKPGTQLHDENELDKRVYYLKVLLQKDTESDLGDDESDDDEFDVGDDNEFDLGVAIQEQFSYFMAEMKKSISNDLMQKFENKSTCPIVLYEELDTLYKLYILRKSIDIPSIMSYISTLLSNIFNTDADNTDTEISVKLERILGGTLLSDSDRLAELLPNVKINLPSVNSFITSIVQASKL